MTWAVLDFAAGLIRVRAQLSRAHRGEPARRVAPKTAASVREIPLVPQLAGHLAAHSSITDVTETQTGTGAVHRDQRPFRLGGNGSYLS